MTYCLATKSWMTLCDPHGLQHTRPLCLPLSPRVCLDSCPLSRQCYLTISSSVTPFSSCPQSFPTSGSFPMSELFASGGQIIGASVSITVIYAWHIWVDKYVVSIQRLSHLIPLWLCEVDSITQLLQCSNVIQKRKSSSERLSTDTLRLPGLMLLIK